jgi:hypothetical protein
MDANRRRFFQSLRQDDRRRKVPANMNSADRMLIQVVPRLLPARCGVSDHAILLATELKSRFGIDTAFVVLNSEERCSLPFRVVHCAPEQLAETCRSLNGKRPGAILIHLSGYGYAADGAPLRLASALERLRADGGFRIGVFFHELSASGMPWTSAFWHARRQKRALRRIAATCELAVTNIRVHVDWLERETVRASASPVVYLPVFSLVGEAQQPVPLAQRDPVMVVFGLGVTRQKAFKELLALGSTLEQIGVRQILDIGPEFEAPGEVAGIPVRRMGALPAEEIAGHFERSTFGFLSYTPYCLAKSGVFAGYCAHGLVPVNAQHFQGEIDGLKEGENLFSPQTIGAMEPAGLERCSMAAWRWYLGHALSNHAAAYARWIDAMESAPQSADRNYE